MHVHGVHIYLPFPLESVDEISDSINSDILGRGWGLAGVEESIPCLEKRFLYKLKQIPFMNIRVFVKKKLLYIFFKQTTIKT